MDIEEKATVRQSFHIVNLISRGIHRRCSRMIEMMDSGSQDSAERLKLITEIQNLADGMEKENRSRLETLLKEEP